MKPKPLNTHQKILRRFYEPLVLLSVLDPTREAIKPDHVTQRGPNEQIKLWRDFLDSASFMCDAETGGDTVTAMTTQKTYEQPVFWLASNSKSRDEAGDHLRSILVRLERFCNKVSSKECIEKELFTHCVGFSSKRIDTYSKLLVKAIDEVREQTRGAMTTEDVYLFTTLNGFQAHAQEHHKLCSFAYTYRSTDSMETLSQRHNGQDQRNIWSRIRHYIGRLGTWTKAVGTLMHAAERFPHYIENARVEVVGPEGPPNLLDASHLSGIEGVILRMLPKDEVTKAKALSQALHEMDRVAGVNKRFDEAYSKMKPRAHAELIILEKFHSEELEFIHDDRYIGCSKPSCYCCHLYMQCHPGNFAPRPCHGNLWINWAPPIPLPSGPLERGEAKKMPRLQEHHTFRMLQEMVVRIRQDLQDQISSKRPKRDKHPDSTTGISSVLALMERRNLAQQSSSSVDTLNSTAFEPGMSDSTLANTEHGSHHVLPADDDDDVVSEIGSGQVELTDDESECRVASVTSSSGDREEDDILIFRGRKVS